MRLRTAKTIKKIEEQMNYFINSADHWAAKGDEENYKRCIDVVRKCEESIERLKKL